MKMDKFNNKPQKETSSFDWIPYNGEKLCSGCYWAQSKDGNINPYIIDDNRSVFSDNIVAIVKVNPPAPYVDKKIEINQSDLAFLIAESVGTYGLTPSKYQFSFRDMVGVELAEYIAKCVFENYINYR